MVQIDEFFPLLLSFGLMIPFRQHLLHCQRLWGIHRFYLMKIGQKNELVALAAFERKIFQQKDKPMAAMSAYLGEF